VLSQTIPPQQNAPPHFLTSLSFLGPPWFFCPACGPFNILSAVPKGPRELLPSHIPFLCPQFSATHVFSYLFFREEHNIFPDPSHNSLFKFKNNGSKTNVSVMYSFLPISRNTEYTPRVGTKTKQKKFWDPWFFFIPGPIRILVMATWRPPSGKKLRPYHPSTTYFLSWAISFSAHQMFFSNYI